MCKTNSVASTGSILIVILLCQIRTMIFPKTLLYTV
jgi:hypothetical protein